MHQVAKVWSFSFNISPSKESSGLISYMIDRFDLLAVQGTLKSLLQHHSSKASILWCSAFFMVQLSHPYMTARETTALNFCVFLITFVFLKKVYWIIVFPTMLIPVVNQSESAIHIQITPLSWISFPFRSPQNIE